MRPRGRSTAAPLAGPVRVHRRALIVASLLVALSGLIAWATVPRRSIAHAEVGVSWPADVRSPPVETTADILRQRLVGLARSDDVDVAITPVGRSSRFDVDYTAVGGDAVVAALNALIGRIATDPAEEARRNALAADLAAADRERGELAEALALARGTAATPGPGGGPAATAAVSQARVAAAEATLREARRAATAATAANDVELRARRDAAQQELAALADRYGPLHPAITGARDRLDAANAALADAQSQRAGLSTSVTAAQRQLDDARAALRTAAAEAADAARRALIVDRLSKANDAAEAHYAALLVDARSLASRDPYTVRLLVPAQPAGRSGPSDTMLLGLFGLVLLLADGLVLLVLEARTPGFRSIAALEAALDRRVVGIVPEAAADGAARARRDPADMVVDRPNTAFAGALRRLLARLQSHAADGAPRVISICSAVPSEGKTTTALALARTAARAGLRTIVVDCDGRRGILSKSLPGRAAAGLVQILDGEATVEDAVEVDASGAAFLRHSATGVFRDLSDARLMMPVLDQLRARFDLVLLDTAPVLGLAESRILASLADEVLLVVRWRATPRMASRKAAETLDGAEATIGGIVLTRVLLATTARRPSA